MWLFLLVSPFCVSSDTVLGRCRVKTRFECIPDKETVLKTLPQAPLTRWQKTLKPVFVFLHGRDKDIPNIYLHSWFPNAFRKHCETHPEEYRISVPIQDPSILDDRKMKNLLDFSQGSGISTYLWTHNHLCAKDWKDDDTCLLFHPRLDDSLPTRTFSFVDKFMKQMIDRYHSFRLPSGPDEGVFRPYRNPTVFSTGLTYFTSFAHFVNHMKTNSLLLPSFVETPSSTGFTETVNEYDTQKVKEWMRDAKEKMSKYINSNVFHCDFLFLDTRNYESNPLFWLFGSEDVNDKKYPSCFHPLFMRDTEKDPKKSFYLMVFHQPEIIPSLFSSVSMTRPYRV